MNGLRRPVAIGVVALAACSGGGQDAAPAGEVSTTSTASTTSVVYTGDPDSEFCRRLATSDERPLLDPFEAGLDPNDVEIRFRALRSRFGELAGVAPPELAEDLEGLVTALDALGEGLAAAGFDFTTMADRGADVSAFDDASFARAATRIEAYRRQVCEAGS